MTIELLLKAITNNEIDNIKGLLEKNESLVNQQDQRRNTPLCNAATIATLEICELLIANGANINQQDASAQTPLHRAISAQRKDICELFLEQKGVDLSIEDSDFCTPLGIACAYQNKEIITLLLDKGANPFQLNQNNHTVITIAEMSGDTEMINFLNSYIATQNEEKTVEVETVAVENTLQLNQNNQTVITIAEMLGDTEMINSLNSHIATQNEEKTVEVETVAVKNTLADFFYSILHVFMPAPAENIGMNTEVLGDHTEDN